MNIYIVHKLDHFSCATSVLLSTVCDQHVIRHAQSTVLVADESEAALDVPAPSRE